MNPTEQIFKDARQIGDALHIDLFYPRHNPIKAFVVGLSDVRAADGIRVSYDFARDGWRIEQASKFEWPGDDDVCDPDWQEVAFLGAWAREADVAEGGGGGTGGEDEERAKPSDFFSDGPDPGRYAETAHLETADFVTPLHGFPAPDPAEPPTGWTVTGVTDDSMTIESAPNRPGITATIDRLAVESPPTADDIRPLIDEWRKGCSCAPTDQPEKCPECTRALIDAISRRILP